MNFGKLKKAYNSARHIYPHEVMAYVFSLIGTSPKILDVGCGTGIATRQLAQKIENISGCDIDEEMIKTAQDHQDNIEYCVASVDKLPFADETFDVVTSFGAFHWFYDDKSVTEIKRVVKKNGFFIVVNKNDLSDFRRNYESLVEKLIGEKPPLNVKTNYDPAAIFSKHNFSNVVAERFGHIDEFTIPRAVEQMQSMSLWNLIPEDRKQKALEVFRNHFEKSAKEGIIYRKVEILVVSGMK